MDSHAHRLFLGVSRSVLGRAWRDRLDIAGLGRAEALSQQQGLPDILARLLAAGAYLVADDLVQLTPGSGRLYATAVAETGLIELRGNGIFRLATTVGVAVTLCVELGVDLKGERLPEHGTVVIAGVEIPRLRVDGGAAALAQILIALTARRAY